MGPAWVNELAATPRSLLDGIEHSIEEFMHVSSVSVAGLAGKPATGMDENMPMMLLCKEDLREAGAD